MSFVDFDCSNAKSDKPVLFWTFCLACFQVIPCADRAVVSDVVSLDLLSWDLCADEEQDDRISHFTSVADKASVD